MTFKRRAAKQIVAAIFAFMSTLGCSTVSASDAAAGDHNPARANAVCSAFAHVVEAMRRDQLPSCNRSEPQATPGFESLHRSVLSANDTYLLSEQLIGFADHGSARYFDAKRAETDKWCADPARAIACKPILLEKQRVLAQGGKWFEPYTKGDLLGANAWRYQPEADIDNDGQPDPLLLLTRYRCGGQNSKGVIERSPTYAFIMNPDYQTVDEARTRQVFGHPISQWPPGLESERFRYIGSTLGIFEYEGKTYFYTLLDSFSDFNGKRVGDNALSRTIGVFINDRGTSRSVCELPLMP